MTIRNWSGVMRTASNKWQEIAEDKAQEALERIEFFDLMEQGFSEKEAEKILNAIQTAKVMLVWKDKD